MARILDIIIDASVWRYAPSFGLTDRPEAERQVAAAVENLWQQDGFPSFRCINGGEDFLKGARIGLFFREDHFDIDLTTPDRRSTPSSTQIHFDNFRGWAKAILAHQDAAQKLDLRELLRPAAKNAIMSGPVRQIIEVAALALPDLRGGSSKPRPEGEPDPVPLRPAPIKGQGAKVCLDQPLELV